MQVVDDGASCWPGMMIDRLAAPRFRRSGRAALAGEKLPQPAVERREWLLNQDTTVDIRLLTIIIYGRFETSIIDRQTRRDIMARWLFQLNDDCSVKIFVIRYIFRGKFLLANYEVNLCTKTSFFTIFIIFHLNNATWSKLIQRKHNQNLYLRKNPSRNMQTILRTFKSIQTSFENTYFVRFRFNW